MQKMYLGLLVSDVVSFEIIVMLTIKRWELTDLTGINPRALHFQGQKRIRWIEHLVNMYVSKFRHNSKTENENEDSIISSFYHQGYLYKKNDKTDCVK